MDCLPLEVLDFNDAEGFSATCICHLLFFPSPWYQVYFY